MWLFRRSQLQAESVAPVSTSDGVYTALAAAPPGACPRLWPAFVDAFTNSLVARRDSSPLPPPPRKPTPGKLPAVTRLIAIGDLHGDMTKTRQAFRLAGLISAGDTWVGGKSVVVQVGDQLDRGGDELEVLYFLERIGREATKVGGAVHVINGNHETMTVAGHYRYALPSGLQDFTRWHGLEALARGMKASCGCTAAPPPAPVQPMPNYGGRGAGPPSADALGRRVATAPGGPITRRFLAPNPAALQVGSTVFVHGGLHPEHAALGLDAINAATSAWMRGDAAGGRAPPPEPAFLQGGDSIVWTRAFSHPSAMRCDCDLLGRTLQALPGAKRMVVGHTIQHRQGINAACGGRVYRVDVGMSAGCIDANPEVLEILDDGAKITKLRHGLPPEPVPAAAL